VSLRTADAVGSVLFGMLAGTRNGGLKRRRTRPGDTSAKCYGPAGRRPRGRLATVILPLTLMVYM